MKKLMLYLLDEEYEFIRQSSFDAGQKMSAYVKDCIQFNGKPLITVNAKLDNYKELEKPISPNNFVKVSKLPKSPNGQCKVCGAGLNQYGDFCIGKGHHQQ